MKYYRKAGRKTKPEKEKIKTVSVGLSSVDIFHLEQMSKRLQMSVSKYIRKLIKRDRLSLAREENDSAWKNQTNPFRLAPVCNMTGAIFFGLAIYRISIKRKLFQKQASIHFPYLFAICLKLCKRIFISGIPYLFCPIAYLKRKQTIILKCLR